MTLSIIKNEPDATKRVAYPIVIYLDGVPESGVTFSHATPVVGMGYGVTREVEVWNGAAYVEAANNTVEDGTSGVHRYQFAQTEVNINTVVMVRVCKTSWVAQGRPPAILYVPIEPAGTIADVVRQNTAQAGGGDAEIVLDTAASAVDDSYAGMVVYITSGTGAGQERTALLGYDGTTKTLPVDREWGTNPDATSVFVISTGRHSPYGAAKIFLDTLVENDHSLADLIRLMVGVLAGTVEDFETGEMEFNSLDGSKVRLSVSATTAARTATAAVDLTGP